MDVMTRSQALGKSLPAELVVGGKSGYSRLMQNGEVLQQRGMRGLGDDTPDAAQQAAQILQATTQSVLPLVVANTPGVYYTQNPVTGQITVSSQPVYTGGYGGMLPPGTVAGGISGSPVTLLVIAGLAALFLMRNR